MQAQLWTLSGLAVELGRDRRSLARALEGLKPDDESRDAAGRLTRRWLMRRAVEHLTPSPSSEYDDQRQRLAAAQAEKVERENAIQRGEVARKADVVRFWTDCMANMRARVLAIGSKLGPQLVNIGDPNLLASAVRSECCAALAELAEYDGPASVVAASADGPDASADADREPVGRPRKAPKQRKQRRARPVAD